MDSKVDIERASTSYKINYTYHSDLRCMNADVKITAIQRTDGTISFLTGTNASHTFVFDQSDPDRVIAIAKMMLAFAEMAKEENKKALDISVNE